MTNKAMYSEKNLAKSFDFGKNGVNKSVINFSSKQHKPEDLPFSRHGYPEQKLLIIERNGDLIIPKN